MKAVKIIISMILTTLAPTLSGCGDGDAPSQAQLQEAAAKGLSLPALTALVKEVRSGQELERKLNQNGGVNNLDLNGDQKVDYISVSEFGDVKQKVGYSLTTRPVKDEVQEIAEVTVEKNGKNAEIQVTGNAQVYGDNAVYNDVTPNKREEPPQAAVQRGGGSVVPFFAGYFVGRALWSSPWGFGAYPPRYMSFPNVEGKKYFSRNKKKYKFSKIRRGKSKYQKYSTTKIRNPNKGKFARRGVVRSLKKPTATQRQFRAARAKNLKSGGFGRSGSKTFSRRNRSSIVRKSGLIGKQSTARGFTSRKSNLFSSGRKSAFGRSKESFGSRSFRSSSFSSRSFSRGK